MEVGELKEKLDGFRPFIVVGGKEIDKGHPKVKEFIELYFNLTGKRVGEGSCKACVLDAYMELSIKTKEQLNRIVMPCKFKIKKGRVVVFQNTDYTNANITEDVVMKMMAFSTKHAGNFENPDEVVAAYQSLKPSKDAEVVIVVENGATISKTETVQNEQPLTLEELKAKYLEEKGKKPHYKWNAAKIMEKLNEN